MSVHIIYITSACDFSCPFCFERAKHTRFTLSKDRIREIAEAAVKEEGQSVFVLFGGEPMLRYDLCLQCMKDIYTRKGNVHFIIQSNGYRFSNPRFTFEFLHNPFVMAGLVTLSISYDGSGQYLRTRHGKDTTAEIERVLRMLKGRAKFRISYTVNHANVRCLEHDFQAMMSYKPERIIVNTALADLKPDEIKMLEAFKQKDFPLPVCQINCARCGQCHDKHTERIYYGQDFTLKYPNDSNVGLFNHF